MSSSNSQSFFAGRQLVSACAFGIYVLLSADETDACCSWCQWPPGKCCMSGEPCLSMFTELEMLVNWANPFDESTPETLREQNLWTPKWRYDTAEVVRELVPSFEKPGQTIEQNTVVIKSWHRVNKDVTEDPQHDKNQQQLQKPDEWHCGAWVGQNGKDVGEGSDLNLLALITSNGKFPFEGPCINKSYAPMAVLENKKIAFGGYTYRGAPGGGNVRSKYGKVPKLVQVAIKMDGNLQDKCPDKQQTLLLKPKLPVSTTPLVASVEKEKKKSKKTRKGKKSLPRSQRLR